MTGGYTDLIEDNLFGDITFDVFSGNGIRNIGSNVFNKNQTEKLRNFACFDCAIQFNNPKFNATNVLGQMTGAFELRIGLNTSELPTSAIVPIAGRINNVVFVEILNDWRNMVNDRQRKLTIKYGAFQHLNQLSEMVFRGMTIEKIENGAFKFLNNSKKILGISFAFCDPLNPNVFEPGLFDDDKQYSIVFDNTSISYLPEKVFKPNLNRNLKSRIRFFDDSSMIDCNDCKNYWMIKEEKEKQLENLYCKQYKNTTLFNENVKTKLFILCN